MPEKPRVPPGIGIPLLLAATTLLGAALRLWAPGRLPDGLYQDEAFNGLDALRVLAGWHPLYFPANNGREPLFIYLVAASVGWLGRTPLAIRLPAALLGVLTIPATYALGQTLFDRRVGLLAACVIAVTFWPLALSRIGLRAVGLPLLLALAAAAAWKGGRQRDPRWLAPGGALYGLSFYTYLAARFTPLALLLFGLYLWLSSRPARPPSSPPPLPPPAPPRLLPAFLLPAFLTALPLALYALAHAETVFGRAGQVSVFSPGINGGELWGTLGQQALSVAGMFLWRGDSIARHNLPGRPVFDPLMGAAFLLGVVVCLRRFRRSPAAAIVLIWVGVMSLPTLLAEDAPHFLRAVGVWPALALLPALGLEAACRRLRRSPYRAAAPFLAAGLLAASAGLTARDYFLRYARDPATGYYFQSAVTELAGEAAAARARGATVYLDGTFWEQFASLRFLLPEGADLRRLPRGETLPPDPGPLVEMFLWPYEGLRPALGALPAGALIEARPGPLYRSDLEPAPYPLYNHYLARTGTSFGPPVACFESDVCLQSVEFAHGPQRGETLIKLRWLAAGAPGEDYSVFLQARSAESELAGADGPPAGGLYPTGWWRPGDLVQETRSVRLPQGVPATGVRWLVGLYNPVTGRRLTLTESGLDYFELRP